MEFLKRLFGFRHRLETLEERQQRLYEERLKIQKEKKEKIRIAEEEKKELEYVSKCCVKTPENYIITRRYFKNELFYDLAYEPKTYDRKSNKTINLTLRNIHELPLDFVEKYKDRIYWKFVGNGFYKNYMKIEKMDIEFVRKFQNEINWDRVGSGFSGNTKIENLPLEFVKEFRHKINWKSVGHRKSGRFVCRSIYFFFNNYNWYTNAIDLSDEFIFEFKNENKYLHDEYLIRTHPKLQVEGDTKSIEYSNEGKSN